MPDHVFILFILLHSITGAPHDGQPKSQVMKNDERLALMISVLSEPVYLGHPLMVKAILINNGDNAVLVNSRMALGYENMPSRELYLKIIDEKSGEHAGINEVDINRDFSTPGDFCSLAPGDSVKVTFNLFEFYQLTRPGKYRLTAYYDASEPLAAKPPGSDSGTVESNSLEVIVRQ